MTEKIKVKAEEPSPIKMEWVNKQLTSIEPKKQDETRETITLTLDRELLKEIKTKAKKGRQSVSRYVEISMRKFLRL